nr:(E,E)-germacrene B synthase-like isoform X2 [Ipomoea batatas]
MAAINQPLSILTSNRPQLHEVTRRSANYHSTMWGDYFLPYSSQGKKADDPQEEWQEHGQLKEKVKNMLVGAPYICSQKLDLINNIQRLGVGYQFENEIEATLQHIFKVYYQLKVEKDEEDDLYAVSLRFRLLRQHGYHVSCNMFEKFLDGDGKFKESLTNNVQAILSLYEASHLRLHGETILDDALKFTTHYLDFVLPNLTHPLRSQVSEALKQPIWKRLTRIEARRYISVYEGDETHDIILLKFAKLDFNLLQKEHQKELGNLTRWDPSVVNELPEYMRLCYVSLLDVYAEMEKELAVKGGSYRINYAKNEMKKLLRGYYQEAKWFHDGYSPKFEEYMKVALVTGAYMMLSTNSLVGMYQDFVTEEAFNWVTREPLMVRASSVICRLIDDMAGHEFEQQRGHLDSAVECYIKQYGKSKEETFNEFRGRVNNAWKDINQECLKPTVFPMPILIRVVNLARVIDLLYKDGDNYTHPTAKLKALITSVLVDPIP